MFGWLAHPSFSLCRRAPQAVLSRRLRRITPHDLLHALPGLGSVLYLHTTPNIVSLQRLPAGVLVAQRAFAPLLEVHALIAVSAVTDEGPREWCECVDRHGRIRARWHLLPDTDYLAWDALVAPCAMQAEPIVSLAAQALRPDRAQVVSFRLRACGGLALLEQATPAPLSPLGQRVAARIAQAESALLRP